MANSLIEYFNTNISTGGDFVANSGNFLTALTISGVPVSTGNIGGGVTISNEADNRVLTSDGSGGIVAESNLVFIPSPSGNKLGIGTINPNGNLSFSNGNFTIDGDSQKSFLTARTVTTDDSASLLYLDNESIKIVLPPKTVWAFNLNVSCYSDTNDGAAAFFFKGCIKRTDSVTAIVGSLIEDQFIDSVLDGISVSVSANDSTHSLDISAQGLENNNIRWTAALDFVQTKYDTTYYFLPMNLNIVP